MELEEGRVPSGSHVMTSEQIMSDLTNAPDNDIVFTTRPPGIGNVNETETDVLVQNCVRLVTAHQSLCGAEGLNSLPKIASEVEQHSKQLTHAISSTTDR